MASNSSRKIFVYGRSFQDPDGHLWEVLWMDPSALEQSTTVGQAGGIER